MQTIDDDHLDGHVPLEMVLVYVELQLLQPQLIQDLELCTKLQPQLQFPIR